jgi:hypothetical protein
MTLKTSFFDISLEGERLILFADEDFWVDGIHYESRRSGVSSRRLMLQTFADDGNCSGVSVSFSGSIDEKAWLRAGLIRTEQA